MSKASEPITIERILQHHEAWRPKIQLRLQEFRAVVSSRNDDLIWEEMVFCFFTGGCSAKMGLRSIEAVKHLLKSGTQRKIANALSGVHRYPNARSRYIVETRKYLDLLCGLKLFDKLESYTCVVDRRDWLARDKGVKGLGYKEASHFLRNIGYGGYAILDKHVLNCLYELKLIDSTKPPNTRSRYLTIEETLRQFSDRINIDIDEMDLVLWSMKTGEILK